MEENFERGLFCCVPFTVVGIESKARLNGFSLPGLLNNSIFVAENLLDFSFLIECEQMESRRFKRDCSASYDASLFQLANEVDCGHRSGKLQHTGQRRRRRIHAR